MEAVNYMTLKQVSALLGFRSRSSIMRDIQSGALPKPIKLSGTLYWDRAALLSHISNTQQESQL